MLACVSPDMPTRKRKRSFLSQKYSDEPSVKRAREECNSEQKSPINVRKVQRAQPVPLILYCVPGHTRNITSVKEKSLQLNDTPESQPSAVDVCQQKSDKRESITVKKYTKGKLQMIENDEDPEVVIVRDELDDHKPIPMAANGVKHCCVNKDPLLSVNCWGFERKNEEKFQAKESPTEPSICSNPNTQNAHDSSKHENRIASVNACACVSVLMEATRHPSKPKYNASQAVTPPEANGDTHKLSSVSNGSSAQGRSNLVSLPHQLKLKNSAKKNIIDKANDTNSCGGWDYWKYIVACASPTTLERYGIIRATESAAESEDVPYNTEGLLWNGETLHPQSRLYLCADGSVPQRIVPPVQPATMASVQKSVCKAKKQFKRKGRKQAAVKVCTGICKML